MMIHELLNYLRYVIIFIKTSNEHIYGNLHANAKNTSGGTWGTRGTTTCLHKLITSDEFNGIPNQVYCRSLMWTSNEIVEAIFQKTIIPTYQRGDTILQKVRKQRKKAAKVGSHRRGNILSTVPLNGGINRNIRGQRAAILMNNANRREIRLGFLGYPKRLLWAMRWWSLGYPLSLDRFQDSRLVHQFLHLGYHQLWVNAPDLSHDESKSFVHHLLLVR